MSNTIPDNWYKYDLPNRLPTPSKANYSPQNTAWLIEFFANTLTSKIHTELKLRYENNSPANKGSDILVSHPQDKIYLPEKESKPKKSNNSEMVRYESFAKQSSILKLFEENSPADIKYFQDPSV